MLMRFIDAFTLEMRVFLIAALPIVELRGAIPVGIAGGMEPLSAVLLSLAGSMLPVPFILAFLKPLFTHMRGSKTGVRIVDRLTNRTEQRARKIKKYSAYGLVFFVAVPFPTTGVWTGAMAASIFNIPMKHALAAIFLGNVLAATVVAFFSSAII